MSKLTKALTAAAGNAGESLYVEDVFSTYLLQSTSLGVSETVSNGVNLLDEGGLVWSKARDAAGSNILVDTERGASDCIFSDSTGAEVNINTITTQFYIDGFESGSWINSGGTAQDYASWSFRKAEKFFDVQTWTGTGSVQNIAHNLGVAPAFIITKKTSGTSNWATNDPSQTNPWSGALLLNSPNPFATASSVWNDTAPTDSVFTVGTADATNVSGQTYVAYLFASDAGGFGDDGSESIIKCGSFTASTGAEVDLGFEPQWVLIKNASGTSDWYLFDNMRGWGADQGSNDKWLRANVSGAEYNNTNSLGLTPTGFTSFNGGNQTFIYIAIRRPMKTPESGTEVFAPISWSGDGTTNRVLPTGFDVDASWNKYRLTSANSRGISYNRLTSSEFLQLDATFAAVTNPSGTLDFDLNNGINLAVPNGFGKNTSGYNHVGYNFKRATGFMDAVAYNGNGSSSGQVINHNLGVTPEIIIIKGRSNSGREWHTYVSSQGQDKALFINSSGAEQANTALVGGTINSTQYELKVDFGNVNGSGETYISYLFATLAGVSKVGSYTGTGSFMDIDCGFSAGARFILIKRTDSTGDWYVWDSERGIVAGNDPYLLLNSTAAEVTSTDYIDPLNSGFRITTAGAEGPLGASGGSYIFLAIA